MIKHSIFYAIFVPVLVYCISCRGKQATSVSDHATHSGADIRGNSYADEVNTGMIRPDTMKGSPERSVMATLGNTHIHITYRSPGVKGRVIWGGLVPYRAIWAAGAHHPTHIRTNGGLNIAGSYLPKGDYALFFIPDKKKWTAIFNTDFKQHMSDSYTPKLDVLRATMAPHLNTHSVPRLTYSIVKGTDSTGKIVMEWDRLLTEIPFRVEKEKG